MMADGEHLEMELSRFWNELEQHGREPRRGELPADQAETLLRLHRMTQAPLPDLAQARVDRAFLPRLVIPPAASPRNHYWSWDPWHAEVVARGHADLADPRPARPLEAAAPPRVHAAAKRARWSAFPYASALLVLVTLGLIVVTLGANRSVREPRSSIPAIQGVSDAETLFEITLPPEALPHSDRVSASLDDYSLDPGKKADWEPAADACCPGLRLTYVMNGALTISSEATAHLLRSGMNLSPELVPAGASVVLGPGDAFVSQFDEGFNSSNPGEEPARFLDITVIDGFQPLNAAPEGWVWHPDGDVKYGMAVPDQPALLRLDRVVLEPDATLPPPSGAYTQLGVTIADNQPLDVCGKDSIRNLNDVPVTVHVATLLPAGAIPLPAGPKEPGSLCLGGMPVSLEESLETIFAATLTEEMIPAAGNLDFLVWRTTLPAKTRTSYRGQIPGFQMQHVLAGDLTLIAEQSLRIYRGPGSEAGLTSSAVVPPGADVILHPGDTAIFPFDQAVEYANLAETPVQLVAGGLFAGHSAWLPEDMVSIDHNEQYPVAELPPGPVQITLVRATLPPEGEIPAPPAGSLVFDVGAVEESDIAKRMDGSLRNIGPEEAAIYVLTLTPLGGAAEPLPAGAFDP